MSGLLREVVTLKEGVEIGKLLTDRQADFEVLLDSDVTDVEGPVDINSVESCLSYEELQKIINLEVTNDDSAEDDDTPFSKYRKKMSHLTEDGKVLKHVVKKGVGPAMHENCVAFVHYRGYFEYQEVPFDSTLAQTGGGGRAVPFDLVEGGLLPGLRLALLSMKKGEEAEFLVHPDFAFGKLGCPPRIPPDATVLFIIRVEKFKDRAYMNIVDEDLDMHERNKFANVFKRAEEQFIKGNSEFSKDNIGSALQIYNQIIKLLLSCRIADEKEERTYKRFMVKVYTKLCECWHKKQEHKKVCLVTADAIRDCQYEAFQNYKLMYYSGCAKMKLGDFSTARNRLHHAGRLCHNRDQVTEALDQLEQKEKRAQAQEKMMAFKMFQPTKKKPPEEDIPDKDK